MSFPVDLVNLILYCVQQLGVMLGVGAETIILIVYFLSMRDGRIEPKEEQFGRAVHRVLRWGLLLIISSGFLITAIHLIFGQLDILFAPAFLLKWLLIAGVWGMEVWRHKQAYVDYIWEGLAGANWFALFALHILAPVAAWADLLVLYVIWIAGFMVCFVSVVHTMGIPVPARRQKGAPAPKKVFVSPPPAPTPVPPAPRKPAPMPVVAHAEHLLPAVVIPAPHKPPMQVPHKPAPVIPPLPHKPENKIAIPQKPEAGAPHHIGLPAIRVMPRTQEDVDNQNRASVVQLSEVKL
jgi:hypothetical protein